jgi:endonuclease/exonuclease/phosphatase family metal-dependent hydrolase
VTEPAPTFTARHPRHRLDVIFAGGPLEVLPHRPVDLDRTRLVAASDHLPVWTDLDVQALRRPLRQA